jgi:WD40 repeat protein
MKMKVALFRIACGIACCAATQLLAAEKPAPEAAPADPLKAPKVSVPDKAQALWQKRLPGYISDLTVARGGDGVLVSTLPNFDRDGGSHKNLFSCFSRTGRMLWSHDLPTPVKAQAFSRDGSEAIAVTHDNEVIAYNRKGKKLWTAEGNCQPMFVSGDRSVLCFHDDDAAPTFAFDIFDAGSGKKTASFPINRDVLALRLSTDQKNIVLGLTGGQVISVGPAFKTLWQATVPGEIVDVDISSGNGGWVAILYRKAKLGAAVFDQHGKKVSDFVVPAGPDEIRFYLKSKSIAFYGNGEKGQVFSWMGEEEGGKYRQLWRRGASYSAHYSPPQVFSYRAGGESRLLAPFEEVSPGSNNTHVLSFDRLGKLALDLPITVAEGAFLYLEDFSPDSGTLAVANDDGTLAVFSITSPPESAGSGDGP